QRVQLRCSARVHQHVLGRERWIVAAANRDRAGARGEVRRAVGLLRHEDTKTGHEGHEALKSASAPSPIEDRVPSVTAVSCVVESSSQARMDRRGFIRSAATAGVAALVTPVAANAAPETQGAPAAPAASVPASNVEVATAKKYASDFMVDVFKSLNIEYMFAM